MTLSSPLFTAEGPGKNLLRDCAVSHPAHIFKGKPAVPGLSDAVGRIQDALAKLGFKVADPKGVFGQSTADAVLKFKSGSHPILGPGQTRPDNIVGIQTIHRLDADIQFKPPVIEFGSKNWRFTFFGNTGIGGTEVFTLFIASTDLVDSKEFRIVPNFIDRGLTNGFKGDTRGTFTTARKASAGEFGSASCNVTLSKQVFSPFLNGSMTIGTVGDAARRLSVFLTVQQLKDESIGSSLTSGLFSMQGQLRS